MMVLLQLENRFRQRLVVAVGKVGACWRESEATESLAQVCAGDPRRAN